jgi:hypothetical protein
MPTYRLAASPTFPLKAAKPRQCGAHVFLWLTYTTPHFERVCHISCSDVTSTRKPIPTRPPEVITPQYNITLHCERAYHVGFSDKANSHYWEATLQPTLREESQRIHYSSWAMMLCLKQETMHIRQRVKTYEVVGSKKTNGLAVLSE